MSFPDIKLIIILFLTMAVFFMYREIVTIKTKLNTLYLSHQNLKNNISNTSCKLINNNFSNNINDTTYDEFSNNTYDEFLNNTYDEFSDNTYDKVSNLISSQVNKNNNFFGEGIIKTISIPLDSYNMVKLNSYHEYIYDHALERIDSPTQVQTESLIQVQTDSPKQVQNELLIQEQTDSPTQVQNELLIQEQTDSPTQVQTELLIQQQTDSPTQVQTELLIQVQNYSPTQVQNYSPTQVQTDSPTQVQNYSPTQVQNYSPTQVQNYSPTQVQTELLIQVQNYSPTQVQNYSPTQVQTELLIQEQTDLSKNLAVNESEISNHTEIYSNDESLNNSSFITSLILSKPNNKNIKDLNKIKLPELQDLAISYKISLQNNNKKKTKTELITDIKKYLSNKNI